MVRACQLAAVALLVILGGSANAFPRGSGPIGAASDSLTTMLAGMAHGQWQRMDSTAGGSNLVSILIPRDKAHFNGAANDPFALDASVSAGIGGSSLTNVIAFSMPAPRGGSAPAVFQHGGGHNNNADGSLWRFDILTAATNINAHGAGGGWAVASDSGLLLLGTDATPNIVNPAGGPSVATFQSANLFATFQWTINNGAGEPRQCATHTYKIDIAPETVTQVFLSGSFCGLSATSDTAPNAYEVYDDATGHSLLLQAIIQTGFGPFTPKAMPSGLSTAMQTSLNGTVPLYNDADDCVYATTQPNSGFQQLSQFCHPATGPDAQVVKIATGANFCTSSGSQAPPFACTEPILCADSQDGPASSNRDIYYFYDDTIGGNNGVVAHNIAGSPTQAIFKYTNGSLPFNIGSLNRSYGCRKADGSIWAWEGTQHIFKIVFDPTDRTKATVSEPITSYSGNLPTNDGHIWRMTYDNTHDCIIGAQGEFADTSVAVWVYKP